MSEPELKPCAHCGGEAVIKQTGKKEITVRCKTCQMKCVQKVLRYSLEWLREKQVEAWNTRMSEWQPISTAPKDGTLILLLGTEGQMETGRWNKEFKARKLDDPDKPVAGAWISGDGWFYDDEVTHWQPLPPPPQEDT